MATATFTRRWRRGLTIGALVVGLVTAVSACTAPWNQEVLGSPDEVVCIYNDQTGALDGKPMLPGSEPRDVDNDYKVVRIPTSNRFWDITTDDQSRDAAAVKYLSAVDAGYKETQTTLQFRFRFNVDLACKWYDQHGRRDTEGTGGDPQFNVRDASTPWQQWLHNNFDSVAQAVNENLIPKYSWEYFEFNYPVNANKDGVVDGEPGVLTRDQIAADFSTEFTNALNKNLGAQYFCGIDYQIGGTCTPIQVQIHDVQLVDQTPVQQRQQLTAQQEANDNAAKQAELTRAGTEAAVAANQATIDQKSQIEAANNAAAIAKAQQDTALAQAQQQASLAQAQIDAAPCIATGTSGADCAELIVAIKNGTLRAPSGGTVNVNPGG